MKEILAKKFLFFFIIIGLQTIPSLADKQTDILPLLSSQKLVLPSIALPVAQGTTSAITGICGIVLSSIILIGIIPKIMDAPFDRDSFDKKQVRTYMIMSALAPSLLVVSMVCGFHSIKNFKHISCLIKEQHQRLITVKQKIV